MAKNTHKHFDTEKYLPQDEPAPVAEVAEAANDVQLGATENALTVTEAPAEAPAETADAGPVEGVRTRRAIMLKQFVPSQDWINVNIVGKGKGTHASLGRIFGVATSTERKFNTLPDGSVSESIAVSGIFKTESYLTGELSEGSVVYFPMAYAEKIEVLFKSQPDIKVIEVDVDIGIEATGKTIPYSWTATAFREGEEMAVLKRLKNSRGRPQSAPALLTAPK